MVLGTGCAPFRGGLLAYADTRGAAKIVEQLRSFAEPHGAHFRPARLLEELAVGDSLFDSWTPATLPPARQPQLAMPGV